MPSLPNLLILICDDLAYGDLGCHGNPLAETPCLDGLYGQSVRLTRHCSGPLCSPARAGLMTGRYHYRTGVVDTYIGRSMMHPEERTLAEILSEAGYRTGIFGKWHLGDCYPQRAIDQGFQEALVHNGGGIGQPGDWEGNHYQDPTLFHNGVPERCEGYCADIFTDHLLAWIRRGPKAPFFGYLAFNTPHSPFEVPDAWVEPFRRKGLPEKTSRVYAMETNIDANVGKVVNTLQDVGLSDDTILVFTSDHGACPSSRPDGDTGKGYVVDQFRYNAGLRGCKGSLYEGGIRVPCFVRWPNAWRSAVDVDRISSPIDLLPTFAAACGAAVDRDSLDGEDLGPLLRGDTAKWPPRSLFMQWHRGDVPERFRNCAVIHQRYKLIDGKELYDVERDPSEQNDIAAGHPDLVEGMRTEYAVWFDDISATRGYAPPRILVGTPHESPTVLTRQDWRGPERAHWNDEDVGFWDVSVARRRPYDLRLRVRPPQADALAHVRIGDAAASVPVPAGAAEVRATLALPEGPEELHAWVEEGGRKWGVRYVDIT